MDKHSVLKKIKLIPEDAKQKEWDAKETVEGSQAKADKALQDAKSYADENKVAKEDGKGLSTNDYTNEDKEKLAGLNNYVLPTASEDTLGGVKVGTGLAIGPDGILSATGGGEADSVRWENIVGTPEEFKPEAHEHSISDINDYTPPTVDDTLNESSENAIQNKAVYAELEKMKKDIGDLLYKQITISVFSNNINTVEIGQTITDVTFNWTLSKEPKKLMFNEETLGNSDRTKTISGQSIKTNTTYTLKATDERDYTATKTTGITFLNGVYNGIGQADATIDDSFVKGLTKKLQGNKASTFTVNAGEGQHIYYAVPTRYGSCSFNVGGFDGGFSKTSTFEFTNASGYKESYDVYKSDNANLGNTTVKVS